ncbi:hypothetical protein [Helicobacter pylori]|uniref:hypothetical protein n=1 Tax=Helicobacter pylori TaxID=210 RepID=UPI000B2B2648|nr:hypothetical protein [Helicobacter pylori]
MHGVNYSVKAFFFFCHLEKILEFLCFLVLFVSFVWCLGGVENHRLTKIKLFNFLKSAF